MTGLDTETHKGKVVLIATPTNHLEVWRYRSREQFHVLFEWLRLQDTRFCCWNADYDIQAILKLLNREPNETIYRETRVRYGRYRLRFIPSKLFTIGLEYGKRKETKTLVTIYDLMQFYASSLEKASTRVLGKGKTDPNVKWSELLEVLRSGGNGAFKILNYCRTDAALVGEMYLHSKEKMAEAGMNFDKPISCASIAMQKFSKSMKHDVPRYINNAFEKTYRGGRIECLKVGYFPKAYLYDLHSAYPSVMANLRETKGNWHPISNRNVLRSDAAYAALLVHVQIPASEYRCPIAVKGDTQLMYPRGQWSQWVDLETFRLLEERDMVSKIVKGYQLIGCSEKKPFQEMNRLYEERQRQPNQSWALKIAMNASYGKVAERIDRWVRTRVVDSDVDSWRGEFWRRKEQWTKRTNFVYASAITAGIRSRLYREINPATCIFYATDGCVFQSPLPELESGPLLGQWSEPEVITDLVVVGSGVYTYKRADGSICTKLRGFEVGLDLYELLDRRRRILTLTVKRNWTLAQVMRQHKYPMFNELINVPRYLDVCFDKKRIWESSRVGRDLLKRSYDSIPWTYYPAVHYQEFG